LKIIYDICCLLGCELSGGTATVTVCDCSEWFWDTVYTGVTFGSNYSLSYYNCDGLLTIETDIYLTKGVICVSGGTTPYYTNVTGATVTNTNVPCCYTPTISECTVLFNYSTNVSAYFPSSNNSMFLSSSFAGSADVAHTTTKLWVYDGTIQEIQEYDITLSPWSATFNRSISYPSGVYLGSGLGAITNTQLISTNTLTSPHEIIVLDITTNTAVSTVIGTLEPNRAVAGDILLTTTNKILVTNADIISGNQYLTQYSYPSGAFEVEVDITSSTPSPYGIFINGGNIYVCDVGGEIYNVNVNSPYAQTLFNDSGLSIGGASQVPSCCDTNLNLSPTPTPTKTPTPTPTRTPTPTPTPL
jgi:hypothetical protein